MAEESATPSLNFGAMLGDKLSEQIRNMDLVAVLKKMIGTEPGDEESVEVQSKLQGVLAQFEKMTPEDRERFTAQIKEGLAQKLSMKLQEGGAIKLDGLEEAIREAVVTRLYVLGFAAFLFVVLVVFFGYKLYKSIKDKELKREEKKKAKQMKKKK